MNKRKFFKVALFLITIMIIFFGFQRIRFGFSNIKWGDYVKYKNITYEGQYDENNERIMISEINIGELLGTTKSKLLGNVHNPYYKMRNGDASLLTPKTSLYKINNNDPAKNIAAKIDGIYYLYSNK